MNNLKNIEHCLELAKVCKASYISVIRHDFLRLNGLKITNQKIIHGSYGRGYCRLFWNKTDLIIVFRGTREKNDWIISNLKAFPVPLRDCPEITTTLVHRGFQRTLDYEDKTTNIRSLDSIIQHLLKEKLLSHKITITGHSMGGALAVLFAVKLRSSFPNEVKKNLVNITTFASPSVGLNRFKKIYADLSHKTIRVVNNADIVPFTPPIFYKHVGKELLLQKGSISTNDSWLRRLTIALKGPLSNFSSDHSIDNYIEKLNLIIDKKKE